jgi:hypothetical protein
MPLKVGDTFTIDVNQGPREAMALARIGNQVLIEYAMPAGSTALQILTDGNEQRGRSMSYSSVPTKWLRAIVEDGYEWEGNPQSGPKPLTAEKTLAQRTGLKAPEPLPIVHAVGCICGSCSAAYERDAWDPRMGEK